MFLDIHHLFISQISADPDIKNPKICLPIMHNYVIMHIIQNIPFRKRMLPFGDSSPKSQRLAPSSKRNILSQIIFF
jgi:hypothetical protein